MRHVNIANIMVLLSFSFLLGSLFMLPNIDRPQPDPYFHIKNTPIIYWIGFVVSVIAIILLLFNNYIGQTKINQGFILIILIAIYIYIIPKIFYINFVYTDTYIFVAELLYILYNGIIGVGHSIETPGLSLISSTLCLITNINHIMIVKILQLIIPMITIIIVYMISNLFTNKKTASLSCFIFMSINWMGFHFNRQSFAFTLQLILYYFIFKLYLSRSNHNKYQYVIIFLSYVSLVIYHPLSSLLVPISLSLYIILGSLYNYITRKRDDNIKINNFKQSIIISFAFILIWFGWNMYTYRNYELLYSTIIQTIREMTLQPNPTEPAQSYFIGYTTNYLPVIYLRLFKFVYETIIGVLLVILSVVTIKDGRKGILLTSWFIGCMTIFPAGLYTGHFFNRTFLHAIPVFSILLSFFIYEKTPLIHRQRTTREAFLKIIKKVFIIVNIIFILILPVSMYCVSPFFYPPTAYLQELDYTTKYGSGYISVNPADSMLGYYTVLNNATDVVVKFPIIRMNTLVTNFRTFTKRAFMIERSLSISQLKEYENGMNSTFGKVYDSDSWHRIYHKQY